MLSLVHCSYFIIRTLNISMIYTCFYTDGVVLMVGHPINLQQNSSYTCTVSASLLNPQLRTFLKSI